jgi:hypothetical protein
LAFVRQYYREAATPFIERKRKIEAEEEPFVPPYSEDSEPAFLAEWIEADESLHVLAYSCVSMLASALHLYLEEWVRQSRVPVDVERHKAAFKKGRLAGYGAHFAERFGLDLTSGPANLDLLGEVVLARNVVQHPPSITCNRTRYTDADISKLRRPFFVSEREAELLADDGGDFGAFLLPTLHIDEAQMLTALTEVEKFAEWFEREIEAKVYELRRR